MKTFLKLWHKLRPPVVRYWIRLEDHGLITWDTSLSIEDAWRHLPRPGETLAGRRVAAISCFRIK